MHQHRRRRRRRRRWFFVFGRHVQRITYVKQRLLRAKRRYILIRTTCRFQVCARTATFACTQYEQLVDRPQKKWKRGRERVQSEEGTSRSATINENKTKRIFSTLAQNCAAKQKQNDRKRTECQTLWMRCEERKTERISNFIEADT